MANGEVFWCFKRGALCFENFEIGLLLFCISKSMANQKNMNPIESEESNGEEYDGALRLPGKKRRLIVNQVQYLETNSEVENKLEPERKVGLAKELGLQSRQVAIWFQIRRARLKTKLLEKDYGSLKLSYDTLMADYDNLVQENEDLKTMIDDMEELLKREKRTKKMGNLEQQEALGVQFAELQNPSSNS